MRDKKDKKITLYSPKLFPTKHEVVIYLLYVCWFYLFINCLTGVIQMISM